MRKIEINLFWHKENIAGETIAKNIFKYFYSGDIAPQKECSLEIPMKCYVLEDECDENFFEDIDMPCCEILYVNILLADSQLKMLDVSGVVLNRLKLLSKNDANILFVPISMDTNGGSYIDKAQYYSFIQNNDQEELNIRELLVYLLNVITNRYYNFISSRNEHTLKLFLCHTKSTASIADINNIKSELSALKSKTEVFIDFEDIAPGQNFEQVIYKNATRRAMVVYLTDDLSSREWCNREIFYAKKYGMPIIIIDALQFKDSRLFAYIGNVPIVKYNGENIGKIQEVLLYEILYNFHNIYKFDNGNVNVKILGRKVETLDIIACEFDKRRKREINTIIYPDPPLHWIERDIIDNIANAYGIKVQTPITSLISKYGNIKKGKVLISSSKNESYKIDGQNCIWGIDSAVEKVVRYLILNGFPVINGGHFDEGGFNSIIIKEIKAYRKRLTEKRVYGYSYVNAYTFCKDREKVDNYILQYVDKRGGKGRNYKNYIDIILPPDNEVQLANKVEQLYLHRKRIVDNCDLHIVIGGEMHNDGEHTGIDQEVSLSVENKKPIYLLGGFGFKAKRLCKQYINAENYLALNNGLTLEENQILANTMNISNIMSLIFKGYKNIKVNE